MPKDTVDGGNMLDIKFVRENPDIVKENIKKIGEDITDNAFIRSLIKLFFDDLVPDKILKTFLYGNYKISETLISAGVARKLSTDNDYIEFLGALFSFTRFLAIASNSSCNSICCSNVFKIDFAATSST